MGKSTSVPAAPDYSKAAAQDNAASQQAWNAALTASRPNQFGADQSISWRQNEDGTWTQEVTPSSNQLALHNAQDQAQLGMLGLAGTVGDRYSSLLKTDPYGPINMQAAQADFSGVAPLPKVGQYDAEVTNAIRELAQPGLAAQRGNKEAQLAAMGLGTGSGRAWDEAQRTLNESENNSNLNAVLKGIEQGNTRFEQGLGLHSTTMADALARYGAAQQSNEFNYNVAAGNRDYQSQQLNDVYSQLAGLYSLGQSGREATQLPGIAQVAPWVLSSQMGVAQNQYGASLDRTNARNADAASNKQAVASGVAAVATIAAAVL